MDMTNNLSTNENRILDDITDKNIQIKQWNWKDVVSKLLAEESPLTKRRLRIRTCDIVFLENGKQPTLNAWYYTSKQGYIVRRCLSPKSSDDKYSRNYVYNQAVRRDKKAKLPPVNLQHVYERYSRIALAGNKVITNTCKTIATLHRFDGGWIERKQERPSFLSSNDLKDLSSSAIGNSALHSFHDEFDGKNRTYRVIITHATLGLKSDVEMSKISFRRALKSGSREFMTETYVIDAFSSIPKFVPVASDKDHSDSNSLYEELTKSTLTLAQHVDVILSDCESQGVDDICFTKSKVHVLVADFVMDCKHLLWLTHVPMLSTVRTHINYDAENRLAKDARFRIDCFMDKNVFQCSSRMGKNECTKGSNNENDDPTITNGRKERNKTPCKLANEKFKEMKTAYENKVSSLSKDSKVVCVDVDVDNQNAKVSSRYISADTL